MKNTVSCQKNIDYIRAMSVEEMAVQLSELFYDVTKYTNATHYIEKWLNSPAEGSAEHEND